jgi:regulator of sigma D
MLDQVRSSAEQWGGVNNIINTWLAERQELIRLYCVITDRQSNKPEFILALENFCEILVDYLSAGHFEVFTELENEARSFDERGIKLVNAIYPYLEQSTEIALWFNDRCDQLRHSNTKHEQIQSELSYLGESLTDRFELEDQLIEYVHHSNAAVV